MAAPFTPKTFPSLKAVLHQCVLHAPNGLDAHTVLGLMGYDSYGTGMAELKGGLERKCDLDRLLPGMDATDSDEPVHFLARHRNGVFVKLPESDVPGCEELIKPLSEAIAEFGDWVKTIGKHMEDGVIENHERIEFDERCRLIIEAVVRFQKSYHTVNVAHNRQRGIA